MFFFFRGQQRRFTFTPKNNLINFYLLTTILQVVLQYDVQYSYSIIYYCVQYVCNVFVCIIIRLDYESKWSTEGAKV